MLMQAKPEKKKLYAQITNLSPVTGAFNFVVTMLGTSMVATAYSFSLGSPYIGIIIELCLAVWSWFAALSTFNSSANCRATSMIDLGRKVFTNNNIIGKVLNFFVIILPLAIVLIGALAGYITISSSALNEYIPIDIVYIQVAMAILIAALGSINSFENTKYVSYFTFVIFLVVMLVIISSGFDLLIKLDPLPQRKFNFGEVIQALPVLALGLNGHTGLPGMAGEMDKNAQRKFPIFLMGGQFFVAIINCFVGFLPSYVFGECTQSDSVLHMACIYREYWETTNVFILIGQICLAMAVVIQAPLLVIPLKELILDHNGKTVRDRSILVNILTSILIATVAGLLAIVLGNIFQTLSTISTVGSLIILGPAAGIASFRFERGVFSKVRSWLLIVLGTIFVGINAYTIVQIYAPSGVITNVDTPMCPCAQ